MADLKLKTRRARRCPLLLSAFRFLAFLYAPLAFAQSSAGQAPSVPTENSQQEGSSVSIFASRLIETLDSVKCHDKKDCTILVADFVSAEGYPSQYGRHLADELSVELSRRKKSIPTADRALLASHLAVLREERVPADIQRSPSVMRWLGKQLNATVVLVGQVGAYTPTTVQVSAHFLSVGDQKLNSLTSGAAMPLPSSLEELSASDPLPALPPLPEIMLGERIYHAGRQGVGLPKCHVMPNPPYTDEARRFKFSGSLVFEAIVDTNGNVKNPRVVRGLPFGLNEISARTISTWRCDPATFEGQPVSTYVPFEVSFRLY